MHELQHEIELKYGKQHIRQVVLDDIDQELGTVLMLINAINMYRYTEYTYESKVDRVAKLAISSEELAIEIVIAVITLEQVITPIQVVISKLVPHLKYDNLLDAVKTAAEILAVCEGDLYTLYHSNDYENDTETLGIKPNYQVSSHIKEFIDNTKYLPPMVCKPRDWEHNYGYGNLTGSGSVLLGSGNSLGQSLDLEALNTLQSIAWELNEDMLEFMETSKKSLDSVEKKSNFNRMVNTSEQVYSDLLDQGNEFYFVWKYDYRGRMYSQGYHVNLQANSYRKAIINFKHKELITNEVLV